MNEYDHEFLTKLKKDYLAYFKNCKVLELGSRTINGTVRDYFENCKFIGVDWVEGEDVDIVCYAHETKFKKEYFDTLISFSMFEHDIYWKESVEHNLPFLKKGGMIFFHWGVPGNSPHGLTYSSDFKKYTDCSTESEDWQKLKKEGHFFPLPMNLMVGCLLKNNIKIIKTEIVQQHSIGTTANLIAKKIWKKQK